MTILKIYRIDNKINQEEMAKKLNCSLPAYRNYENGKRTIPTDIIVSFLKIRGLDSDLRIVEALDEFKR